MSSQNKEVLCTYHYDALDCLIGFNSAKQDTLQRFYCKTRLATEVQGSARCSIVQQGDLLLAQQKRLGDALETALLATDQQRSVMHTVGKRPLPIVYSPYGHRRAESGLTSLLGFNGERPDAITGRYLLGNGHRAFNPVLMRFDSPDKLSPFAAGGINAYSYCSGDPVNRSDPTGKSWFNLSTLDLHYEWLRKNSANRWRQTIAQNISRSDPSKSVSSALGNRMKRPRYAPDTLRVASADKFDRNTLHEAFDYEKEILYATYDNSVLIRRKFEFDIGIKGLGGLGSPLSEKLSRYRETPRAIHLMHHELNFSDTLVILRYYPDLQILRSSPEPNLVPSKFISKVKEISEKIRSKKPRTEFN